MLGHTEVGHLDALLAQVGTGVRLGAVRALLVRSASPFDAVRTGLATWLARLADAGSGFYGPPAVPAP